MSILLDHGLDWRAVAAVAKGQSLSLSPAAWDRLRHASRIVEAIVDSGVRAYGINTGVGALSDTVVTRSEQSRLSRHILLSHAAGVGPILPAEAVRAIIAAQISNFAHGHSGVREEIVATYLAFLEKNCIPDVPSKGSAGYLTHNAHIALVMIGEGQAHLNGEALTGREAMARLGLSPVVLQAKEGLSLVNGSACATGLTALALARAERLLDWADAIACLSLEAVGSQMPAFSETALALRPSPGIDQVGRTIRDRLAGSARIEASQGQRTQDALSLRAIPHVHGAARDVFAEVARVVNQELASVSDNPTLTGTPEHPVVTSQAHAVAPALGQAADQLAIALAQLAGMSERRLDRLVNPLVSRLPAFLASDPGCHSGFMIAQYTAATLVNDNRRLAAPAATDGGITSGLQEDFLAHPTAAANKLHAILDNAEYILAIEWMAAAQAQDSLAAGGQSAKRAGGTEVIYAKARASADTYRDDRPLAGDIEALAAEIRKESPPAIP